MAGSEECDDGNVVNGDGCSAECMIEPGFSCYHFAVPPYPCGAIADQCGPVCGDGKLVGNESLAPSCDDGNRLSDDGCSSICQVECGYSCAGGSAQVCTTTCGDGLRAGSEQCDDGMGMFFALSDTCLQHFYLTLHVTVFRSKVRLRDHASRHASSSQSSSDSIYDTFGPY